MLLTGLHSRSPSLQKESFWEDPKNFMKFQAGVSKFQFKVSFSTSKFPIRVLKLGARTNRFDRKHHTQPNLSAISSQNLGLHDAIYLTNSSVLPQGHV